MQKTLQASRDITAGHRRWWWHTACSLQDATLYALHHIRIRTMRKSRFMGRRDKRITVPKNGNEPFNGGKPTPNAPVPHAPAPALPHEKDETHGELPATPDAKTKRAFHDLAEGQEDTDCHNSPVQKAAAG
jgi:hypothetical protein